ncbi:hypothetical protein BD289DRAFT_449290 [Coniella lustricola]|uniref:2EXR domain-containing protein n=1 Tax=Coniella lustricola TaxID=2025994 RepID=A0A2T3ANC2_9PEZI|nr:hypothetical protein BD289DRAFT_449290 [Coniella lustricola]
MPLVNHPDEMEKQRTFHPFPRLPAELRWKIWSYNLPGPRIVSIRCGSDVAAISPPPDGRPVPLCSASHPGSPSPSCTSPAPIPINLHVCHEARREALRRYRPCFGIARGSGRIYFDSNQDTLYFGPRDGFMASEAQLRTVLSLCDPAELARVTRIAVNDGLFWIYDSPVTGRSRGTAQSALANSLLVDVLYLLRARLPGLKELVFVPRDENPLYSGDCCLVEPAIIQSLLARQVREAMRVVFEPPGPSTSATVTVITPPISPLSSSSSMNGNSDGQGSSSSGSCCPWRWRVMTLSANPNPVPSPKREQNGLLWRCSQTGLNEPSSGGSDDDDGGHCIIKTGNISNNTSIYMNGHLNWRGSGIRRSRIDDESTHTRGWVVRGSWRLSMLEESARKQFLSVEMDVCG